MLRADFSENDSSSLTSHVRCGDYTTSSQGWVRPHFFLSLGHLYWPRLDSGWHFLAIWAILNHQFWQIFANFGQKFQLKGSKFLKVGVTQNLVQVRLGHCKAKDSARQILGWTKARPNPIFSYIYTSSDSTQFISAENCFRDRKIFPVAINVSECSCCPFFRTLMTRMSRVSILIKNSN